MSLWERLGEILFFIGILTGLSALLFVIVSVFRGGFSRRKVAATMGTTSALWFLATILMIIGKGMMK